MSGVFESSISSLRKTFQGEESEDEQSLTSQVKKYTKLTWKQRLFGFIISASIAAVFAILGCALAFVNTAVFAVLFTIGTIIGVLSTLFLVGPINQAKQIINTKNVIAMVVKIVTIIAIVLFIVLTFCAVFWWKLPGLAILFCVLEFIAVVVYAITLIPFAMTVISHGARGMWSSL